MYKLNKNTNMTKLILRGNYLTKKFFKKNSKQTLIFLRAPKHFNIGKHKVSSFVNFKSYLYNVNYSLFISQFLLNKNFFDIKNNFKFKFFYNKYYFYTLFLLKKDINYL